MSNLIPFDYVTATRLGAKLPEAVVTAWNERQEALEYSTEPILPSVTLDSTDKQLLAYLAAEKRLEMWERTGEKRDKAVKAKAAGKLGEALGDKQGIIDALCGAANKIIAEKSFTPEAIQRFDTVIGMASYLVNQLVGEARIPYTRVSLAQHNTHGTRVTTISDAFQGAVLPGQLFAEARFWYADDNAPDALVSNGRPDYIQASAAGVPIKISPVIEYAESLALDSVKAAVADLEKATGLHASSRNFVEHIYKQAETGKVSWFK